MTELTSIKALAEMLQNQLEPKPGNLNKIDIEDLVEQMRNAYSAACWELYMNYKNDGDGSFHTVLLSTKRFEVTEKDTFLQMDGVQVVDLPRDAGMFQLLPVGKTGDFVYRPFLRSDANAASRTKSRIRLPLRYYRIGNIVHFPDGLPEKIGFVDLVFYGLTDNNGVMNITRTIADKAYEKVLMRYAPTAAIPSDVTPNMNPNIPGRG